MVMQMLRGVCQTIKKTLASEHTNLKKETLMGLRRAKVFQAFARACGAAHIVNMQIKG